MAFERAYKKMAMPGDLILVSDIDEIPRRAALEGLLRNAEVRARCNATLRCITRRYGHFPRDVTATSQPRHSHVTATCDVTAGRHARSRRSRTSRNVIVTTSRNSHQALEKLRDAHS